MEVLADQVREFPDLAPQTLDERGLSDRDAAFMHAVYDAAMRRWTTIEWIVGRAGGRECSGFDPITRAGLIAGSAQLLLLDRVPDHAAIDETVEWVKGAKGRGAGGLVNAVLRKVAVCRETGADGSRRTRESWTAAKDEIPLGDGRALVLRGVLMPDDPIDRIAAATGVAAWLVKRWAHTFGIHEARRVAWHSIAPAPVILNAVHASKAIEFPVAAGGTLVLRKHERDGHLCAEGSRAALVAYLDQRPDLWVQDPSSSEAVESVGTLRPGLIVDLCAGQGTKTRQLAAMFPAATIIATDVDPARLATLRRAVERIDRVRVLDSREVERQAAGRADLVLIDVPCSNTGVLARRIEARHRAGPQQLDRLSRIQAAILDRASALRGPGGSILYATCSVEAEENEAQVEAGCGRHGLRATGLRRTFPGGGPGQAATTYRDGSFSALLT